MLKAGDSAPEFNLKDDRGSSVTLAELLKNGPLLLYFYPADFTPGCTREACEIRDMHEDISDVGIQVVGVSPQDGDSHAQFRDKYSLPFKLLADPEKKAVKAYDVDGPLGMGVRRATFLIDTDGIIEDVVMADFRIGKHSDFIREALKQRKSSA